MSKITPCLWFADKVRRVAETLLKMVKLDVAGLRKAYEGAR